MIDLLILTLIIVFIVDVSGIVESVEQALSKRKKTVVRIPRPWSCSLCLSWWAGLIYLFVTQSFTIPMIGFVALMSLMTPVFSGILVSVRELLLKIVWLWS